MAELSWTPRGHTKNHICFLKFHFFSNFRGNHPTRGNCILSFRYLLVLKLLRLGRYQKTAQIFNIFWHFLPLGTDQNAAQIFNIFWHFLRLGNDQNAAQIFNIFWHFYVAATTKMLPKFSTSFDVFQKSFYLVRQKYSPSFNTPYASPFSHSSLSFRASCFVSYLIDLNRFVPTLAVDPTGSNFIPMEKTIVWMICTPWPHVRLCVHRREETSGA
jgi:hypothetical protein